MPQSVPVDHDPFADEKEAPGTSIPVEGDPFAEETSSSQTPIAWGDVASSATRNALPSAGRFVSDLYQVARHPVDTATSLGRIGLGALQKTGLVEGDEYQGYADAVGQYFKERYGSGEGFKRALAEDPIGVLGDASMALTGGGGALVKGAETAGRFGTVARVASEPARMVGRGAEIAGKYTNPLTPVAAVSPYLAKGASYLTSELAGFQTGVPGAAFRMAAGAGYEGGDVAKDFRDHLRGKAPMTDPVDDARSAMDNIRKEHGQEYVDAISKIDDTTPLSFNDIDDAFARAGNVRQFKGVSLSNSTNEFRNKLGDALTNWRNLDPAQYHTAAGLDGLKKQIWEDFLSRAAPNSPEAKIAGDVYNATKQTIIKQNPEYGKIMKGYEDGKDILDELGRTLSLKGSATDDTALRKLQSVLRNNVNTDYGYRRNLAEYLVRAGSPTLIQKLAGQALNSPTPRGLARFSVQLGSEVAAIISGAALAHPAFAAMVPMMMAAASPRLMGEGAYLAGRAASPLKYVPSGTASTARAVSPYTQTAGAVEPGETTQNSGVRGALPVAASEFDQSTVSGVGGTMKGAAILSTGVGGSREDIGKHYQNYNNFNSMSPQEQKAALAALHGDTNISINERKRLEKMMMDRGRGPALPEGVPPGSRAQRSESTGLVRWLAPDGTIYSPSGNLAH